MLRVILLLFGLILLSEAAPKKSRFGKRSLKTMVAQERKIMLAAHKAESMAHPPHELMEAATIIDNSDIHHVAKPMLVKAAIEAEKIVGRKPIR